MIPTWVDNGALYFWGLFDHFLLCWSLLTVAAYLVLWAQGAGVATRTSCFVVASARMAWPVCFSCMMIKCSLVHDYKMTLIVFAWASRMIVTYKNTSFDLLWPHTNVFSWMSWWQDFWFVAPCHLVHLEPRSSRIEVLKIFNFFLWSIPFFFALSRLFLYQADFISMVAPRSILKKF